jgi:hypothetical protein
LPTDKTSRALADALPLLSFSLANIARETEFFKQTADAYRLDLHTGPTDALLGSYEPLTKSYVDFLIATAAGGSLEEGLVVLWAMEKVQYPVRGEIVADLRTQCYLTAWQSALKLMQSSSWATMPNDDMSATQKALKVFIDNWTCTEFVGFVDDCTAVVDGLGLEDGGHVAQRCEEVRIPPPSGIDTLGVQVLSLPRTEILAICLSSSIFAAGCGN